MDVTPVGITTVERWVFERQLRPSGVVPPWLEPGKAWPPMPGPDTERDQGDGASSGK
jgi:hypothetical protein